jgi:HlyD family secretion protein
MHARADLKTVSSNAMSTVSSSREATDFETAEQPKHGKRLGWVLVAVSLAMVAGGLAWLRLKPAPLPPGFAMSNGRIEAIQIDIATQLPGRVQQVLANEGDFVDEGQVVARMDTQTFDAQLRQAQAQIEQAHNAVTTARAVVAQRESELAYAQETLRRTEDLVAKGFASPQKRDADRAAMLSARAAWLAARSQVVETKSAVVAAQAVAERIKVDLADTVLKAPRTGRVQYRLAEPGEVLPAGGKVLSILDLADVYMTLFLPETLAGKLATGAEARIVLDAAPQYVIPAKVTFVAAEAQFTPKSVETASEREKLSFRVKAQIDPELLHRYRTRVKAGLPGVAYVRIAREAQWPESLQVKLPPQ